jgi:integrase
LKLHGDCFSGSYPPDTRKKKWEKVDFKAIKDTETDRRIRWLTRDDAETLIGELPSHLAAMAAFSLETGLRRANVTGLLWSQVDLENRQAWIRRSPGIE